MKLATAVGCGGRQQTARLLHIDLVNLHVDFVDLQRADKVRPTTNVKFVT